MPKIYLRKICVSSKRHELYNSQDEIDKKRDTLIKQIEKQMQDTSFEIEELFRVQWKLVG